MAKRKSSSFTEARKLSAVQISSAVVILGILYLGEHFSTFLDIIHNHMNAAQVLCVYMVMECAVLALFTSTSYSLTYRSGSTSNKLKGFKGKLYYRGSQVVFVLLAIPIFHLITVLFGAPVIESFIQTLCLSCLLSLSSVLHCTVLIGPSLDSWIRIAQGQSKQSEGAVELCALVIGVCSVVGAWFGAFPIPLDWDRDWQIWPISCLIGTLLGHAVGLIFSSVLVLYREIKQNRTKII